MRLYPTRAPEHEAATYENSRTTGFGENWNHALNMALNEDLPILSRMIPSETETARNRLLYNYNKQGVIPDDIFDFYDGDPDGLAYYARNSIGLKDVPTREEFEAQRREEYSMYRENSSKVFNQSGVLGKLGQMAGTMHAMALDPLYATSFLTGYGAAATVGQAALRVGLTEAAIETAAQPFKMSWKEEIGADYDASDALTQIAFAGLGSASITALGKGIGKLLTPKDLKVKHGIDVFEALSKNNPELEPVVHVLKNADPEESLERVLRQNEEFDIRNADRNPRAYDPYEFDPVAQEIKASDIEARAEKRFYERTTEPVSFEDELKAYNEFIAKGEGQRDVQVGTKKPAPVKSEDIKTMPDKEFEEFMRFSKYSPEERDLLIDYRTRKEEVGARRLAPADEYEEAVFKLDDTIKALENC